MGNLLNIIQSTCIPPHRGLGLPPCPSKWSPEDRIKAARSLFERYDVNKSNSISAEELVTMFRECNLHMSDFGVKEGEGKGTNEENNFSFEEEVANVYAKHNFAKSKELRFDEFVPIFMEMLAVMTEVGYIHKKKLKGLQNLIEESMGQVHVLIASLDYRYKKELELTGVVDGKSIESLAQSAGVKDIVTLYDTENSLGSRMFPHAKNIKREMESMGKRCGKKDVFVFFYSGHGLNVPDLDGDESDGEDEAFATPDKDGDLVPEEVLIDDDFARYLDKFIPKETRILCITDCCHSGSICDVNSFNFEHRIIALASAQDNQESLDMSTVGKSGGILTTAIKESVEELNKETIGGVKQYSVHEIYNKCLDKTNAISMSAGHEQRMNIQCANVTAAEFPWPFCV